MLIEPADDPAYRKVTFTWANPDPTHPPRDVLVRLQTLTDKAWADGDLSPFLLAPDGNGTWRTTLEFRADLRVSYRFYLDFDGILRGVMPGEKQWYGDMRTGTFADPLNPRSFPGLATRPPSSLLELPDAPPQPWSAARHANPAGAVSRDRVTSVVLGNTRPVWTYVPAGYDPAGPALPMVVLLDGDMWMDIDVATTLDNLIAAGAIAPVVVVMVACLDKRTRARELTGVGHRDFLEFLLHELLPWAHQHWALTTDPGRSVIAGQSFGGLTAAYAGLRASHRFGLVLTQSGSYWWPDGSEFGVDARALIREYVAAPAAPIRIWQEAGLVEWLLLDANRHMRDVLLAKGYDVAYREYHGGHDYACWRGGLADGLIHLLAPSRG